MLKKITLFIIFLLLFLLVIDFSYWWDCNMNWDIKTSLESCISKTTVLQASDLTVDSGFKTLIVGYITKISTILAIVAVWSVAYWSMLMVVSFWEDEKIKKWRNIIKWALIWFLVLVSATGLIQIVIYVMYWL